MEYQLKQCTEKQLSEIMAIFNEAILNTTALYDYKPRTLEMMQTWYNYKQKGNYKIIGAFDESNTLLGFATYGPFREQPAYKYTVEHSIYVRSDKRGNGLGKTLLEKIINEVEEQDYHLLVGVIDASNSVSIHLHKMEGFVFCGLIKESGFKFGKWLDVAFYQKTLKTPKNPEDDC